MTARISLPPTTGQDAGPVHAAFFENVIGRLGADPAIDEAAAVSHIPLSGAGSGGYITIEGRKR
jgi:hypothetical protein